jgi:hypothetical protein
MNPAGVRLLGHGVLAIVSERVMKAFPSRLALGAASALLALPAAAEQSGEELAMQLANPVAALISVPLQLNFDRDVGPLDDGTRFSLNLQPVVPLSLNEDWNVISRTILPLIDQEDVFPGAGGQSGLGDVVQSFFFSPVEPTAGGWIWGIGPALLLPTATDRLLGADQWGAGPTAVALRQQGPWTYGALTNHLVSVAGDGDRADINATFLQPFLSYTTPTAWTFTLSTESTYDWEGEQWTVPVNALAMKVTRIGDQLLSLGGGLRYYAESPAAGPEGWGARLMVTLLFPR